MGKLLFSVRIHLLINSVNEYLVNIFHVPNTVVFYKSKVVKRDCIKWKKSGEENCLPDVLPLQRSKEF